VEDDQAAVTARRRLVLLQQLPSGVGLRAAQIDVVVEHASDGAVGHHRNDKRRKPNRNHDQRMAGTRRAERGEAARSLGRLRCLGDVGGLGWRDRHWASQRVGDATRSLGGTSLPYRFVRANTVGTLAQQPIGPNPQRLVAATLAGLVCRV
jgi:hypothetical protein